MRPTAKKDPAIGVPTVKQFYIKIKTDEIFLVRFVHFLACKV